MKTISLVQGTPEWHAHRATSRNASEAAAMLGFSNNTTRSELLRMRATGSEKEFTDWVKANIIDKGHEVEAAARPAVEEIVGESLYPATATTDDGYLSASFDGVTMDEALFWECKSFNQQLAAYIEANNDLPDTHWPQVEQQFMVSMADKGLFTLADADGNVRLQHWYESRPERQAQLLAGWKQFDEDLANYVHVAPEPVVVAAPIVDLPAVSVQVSGQIAVIDNFELFEAALRDFVENRLIRKPETDQDFADLDTQIKSLKKAEAALDAAETHMLAQVSSIDAMKRTKDMLHKLARDNRLMAEKLLEAEKVNRRVAIQDEGKKAYAEHVEALNKRLGKPYMPALPVDFVGVTKGLKSMDSAKDRVATELARAKIAANEVADRIDMNLKSLRELAADHAFLFSDTAQLVLKPNDDLVNLIKLRISEHKAAEQAKLDAERERIRAEEEAKAKAEAEAKVRAEMAAKAAQEREEAEAKAKAERGAAAAEKSAQEAIEKAAAPVEVAENGIVLPKAPNPETATTATLHTNPVRPSNDAIVRVVANHYGVDFATALRWIADVVNGAEVAA